MFKKQKIHLNSTEQQNQRIWLKVNLTENSTKKKNGSWKITQKFNETTKYS